MIIFMFFSMKNAFRCSKSCPFLTKKNKKKTKKKQCQQFLISGFLLYQRHLLATSPGPIHAKKKIRTEYLWCYLYSQTSPHSITTGSRLGFLTLRHFSNMNIKSLGYQINPRSIWVIFL
jgi:hypothetical protein